MGIAQEKRQAHEAVQAAKPTELEVKLAHEFFVAPVRFEESRQARLAVLLAQHRIEVTAQILVGEGYETPQDIEKRQVLSARCASLETKVNAALESNTRLTQSYSMLFHENAALKQELEKVRQDMNTTARIDVATTKTVVTRADFRENYESTFTLIETSILAGLLVHTTRNRKVFRPYRNVLRVQFNDATSRLLVPSDFPLVITTPTLKP